MTFGNAPWTSRKSTDATFFLLHASLIEWVSSNIESEVQRAGLPLNWVLGSTSLNSQK